MNKNPFLKDALKHITIVEQVGDDVIGRSKDGKHRVRFSNAKLIPSAVLDKDGYVVMPLLTDFTTRNNVESN